MATRNIVPRATGEGNIGTVTKKWAKVITNEIVADNIDSDPALTTDSDTKIPTQKAVKAYVDTKADANKGVTNGDSHDHSGGDGAQIAYASLSGTPMSPIVAAMIFGGGE